VNLLIARLKVLIITIRKNEKQFTRLSKMKRALKLCLFLATAAFPLAAQPAQAPSPMAAPEPRNVTYCELAKDPAANNHELIRLTAFVTHGFEDFVIAEPNCPASSSNFSIWVMYGGNAESNTMYCCPGEASKETRAESLKVEGIVVPLVNDLVFQQFVDLLKKESDTTVRATVVGRFFSGTHQTINGSDWWRGFGHLGCCSLFVIQRVDAFEPHTRNELDYTEEAGYYEKEGCNVTGETDLKHVSVSLPMGEGANKQALAEQAMADSGERSWAFTDPQRVAVESLRAFYKNKVPLLRNVKKTPTRQVFRWRNGKQTVIVVVTRPYWLSIYAKSSSVAWVSTMIKEVDCH
jgi:hypothetical protein